MLDILGAMAFSTIAVLAVGALTVAGSADGSPRRRLAWGSAAWFALITGLAAAGVFSRPSGFGTLALGAAVLVPILAGLTLFAGSLPGRAFALGMPLAVLVGVHVGRLLGGFMVALHAAGRLPPTFALTAGWGDVLVAAAAVPVAWAVHRRLPGWRPLTLAWNTVGVLDLVVAVSLGVGSAADSPLRFIFESPASDTMGTLPWALIPGFLVPIYMLTHGAIFAQLALPAVAGDTVRFRTAA